MIIDKHVSEQFDGCEIQTSCCGKGALTIKKIAFKRLF